LEDLVIRLELLVQVVFSVLESFAKKLKAQALEALFSSWFSSIFFSCSMFVLLLRI